MALAPIRPITSTLEALRSSSALAFSSALQRTPVPTAPPTPVVQPPVVQPAVTGPSNGAAQLDRLSAFAATFPQSPPPILPVRTPEPPAPQGDPKLDAVVDGMAQGKSLDIASRDAGFPNGGDGLSGLQKNPDYKVERSEGSDVTTTSVTDPSGRKVVEYYDHAHDQYRTEVTPPGGKTVVNPQRNPDGWKIDSQYDPKTKVTKTRLENDLGGGEVRETTKLANGATVQVDIDAAGKASTLVSSPDGTKTTIDGRFDPTGVDPKDVMAGVRKDKTELTDKDIAAFQVAGYEVRTTPATSDTGDIASTAIIDPATGETLVTSQQDHKSDRSSVRYSDDRGGEVTRSRESDGAVVERETNRYGVDTVRTTRDGNTTVTVAGQAVEPSDVLENGAARVTLPNGDRAVILPDGKTVTLDGLQDGDGGYGAFIEKGLAEGKSLDLLAKRLGWSRDQVVAEVYLNGAEDVQIREGTAAELGLDPKTLGVSDKAKVTVSSVTDDGVTLNSVTTPANDGKPFEYEVKENENLWDIAERHGLTVEELLENPDNARIVDGNPDAIDVGNRFVIENGTQTFVTYTLPKDDIALAGPTNEPVTDGGQITHDAKAGETPKSIAAQYPWLKPADVVAANPRLADGPVRPGDKIVIPDSVRLAAMQGSDAARSNLSAADAAALTSGGQTPYDAVDETTSAPKAPGAVQLVDGLSAEMEYATRRSATPVDGLPALTAELKARKPGDAAWAAAVDLAAEKSTMSWAAQGRSPVVMDPLYAMANPAPGEVKPFKDHVNDVFKAAAVADPTPAAVERTRDMLLTYGPQDPASQQAIKDAAQDLLVNDPKARAAEIQKAYDEGGTGNDAEKASAGARKLAELTDPKTVDPLTAALILKEAQPTVDRISADLEPYDLEKIASLNASDANIVKEEGTAASGAYADLSAAAESAARSPEGTASVERLAGQLKDRDLVSNTGYSMLNGGGVSLSLEIAAQLRGGGNPDGAAKVENGVLTAVNAAEKRLVDKGTELGQLAAPIVLPESEWSPFLEEGQIPENWFTDQETLDKIEGKTAEVDKGAQWLELAYQGIERHGQDLQGSPSAQALAEKGDPSKMDPKLRMLFDTSPAAGVERLRLMNGVGQSSGGLDAPTVIPEWSWPARVARNTAQNGILLQTGTRPAGVGLSLFGLGTYALGTSNKVQEGGSSYVTAGLYVAGGVTEAWALLGHATKNMNFAQGGAAWQKVLTSGAGGSNAIKLFNNAPLRALGWWNAYNSLASLSEGELVPAFLHGAAAGGIFAATTRFTGGSPAWLKGVKWAKFGGNVVTLLASTGLAVYDMYEKRKPIESLAGNHKDFLKAAGIDPAMADALGILPGEDGVSVAPRLEALAAYRGTTPQEVMKYLLAQDPRAVFELSYAAAYVKRGEDGTMPVGEPSADWERKPDIKADFRPINVAELNQFIDHYMPDFPGHTP